MNLKLERDLALLQCCLYMCAGSPISPNPSISKNTTHFIILWSPPFLWPGQRIQHYNVCMSNKYNGSIAHHMVNTTSINPFVTLFFPMGLSSLQFNTQNILSCPKITFSISPVDGITAEPMQTFNISDWAWNFPSGKPHLYNYQLHNNTLSHIFNFHVYVDIGSEFTVPAINTSVLFKADGAPALVEVYVQVYNDYYSHAIRGVLYSTSQG